MSEALGLGSGTGFGIVYGVVLLGLSLVPGFTLVGAVLGSSESKSPFVIILPCDFLIKDTILSSICLTFSSLASFFFFLGKPLCFVDAKSSSSFSVILLTISKTFLDTPLFGVSPLLTDNASPINFCCCWDTDFSDISPSNIPKVVGGVFFLPSYIIKLGSFKPIAYSAELSTSGSLGSPDLK